MTIEKGFDPSEKIIQDKIVVVHNGKLRFKEPDYVPFPSPTLYPSTEIFPQQA